ncbi:hypothetical protein HYPSUDRAFT_66775 [Hypholoma sublateritium FD-334 SS-4]|uniref:Uncharacterized protein n=1 Tax=Hypholoma sublateritium (strain FD-334 SS-4) TaxID=945553 RepID=A0A0D2L6Z1_HYPSF|nr:hypothetical protein HYPSUDRAFT_66775 [Hypholoma sublateritium FD-334 SS-4]
MPSGKPCCPPFARISLPAYSHTSLSWVLRVIAANIVEVISLPCAPAPARPEAFAHIFPDAGCSSSSTRRPSRRQSSLAILLHDDPYA